jgi:hypothetical protein
VLASERQGSQQDYGPYLGYVGKYCTHDHTIRVAYGSSLSYLPRSIKRIIRRKKRFGPWSPPRGRLQGRLKPYPSHLLPRSPAAATGGSRRAKPGRCRWRGPPLYPAQVLPRWGWRARGGSQWWLFLRGEAAGRQASEAAALLGVVGWRRGGAGAARR